jgi:hypothetical protein
MTSSRQREIFKTWLFVTEDKVPRPGTSTFEEYSSNEDDPSHENSFKVVITGDIGDDEEIRPSDKDKVKSSEEGHGETVCDEKRNQAVRTTPKSNLTLKKLAPKDSEPAIQSVSSAGRS